MHRPAALLTALALILIAAVVAFLLSGPTTPATDWTTPIDAGASTAGTQRTGELPSRTVDGPAQAPTRRAVDDAGAGGKGLHPSVVAALAGFTGRVVSSKTEPVADSLVRVYRFALDQAIRPGLGVFADAEPPAPDAFAGEARTGADGRFTIEGIFPNAFFLLRADVDGDAPTNRIVQRTPGPAELVDLGDIVLQDCGVLIGRVVDDAEQPIPGAWVRAVDLPGQLLALFPVQRFDPEGALVIADGDERRAFQVPGWVKSRIDELPLPATYTDADGRFRLTGVVPGGNLFTITKTGWLDHTRDRVEVEAGAEKDLGTIRLREGELVWGKVTDEEGEPIAGAEVVAAGRSPNANIPVHFGRFAPPTDADGGFELGGFPPGDAFVAARRQRGDPWTIVGPQSLADAFVVTLASRHLLTLAVVDEAGEAIASPHIQVQSGKLSDGAVELTMFGVSQPVPLQTRQRSTEDGRIAIEGLVKGDYTVLADAPGYAVTAADVTLDGPAELTVVLQPQTSFQVLALDADGAPVAGAAVFAQARGPQPRVPRDTPLDVGTTGEDGRLTVDALRATEARVTASHPAYGNAHGETPIPAPGPLVLRFDLPGGIAGSLLEGGREPTPGKWMVFCMRNSQGGDGERGAMPDMPRLATPALDGSFRITGLKPGRYQLNVVRSIDVLTSPGRVMEFATAMFMMGETDDEETQVLPGQVTSVTLDALAGQTVEGPAARVTGSVVVDGRPGRGYLVSGWGQGRRLAAEVDDAGRFDLGLVPVGDTFLQVMEKPSGDFLSMRRMGDEIWQRRLTIEEGKDVDLTIDIQTSRIEGVVVLADGSPVAGARVNASGEIDTGALPGSPTEAGGGPESGSSASFREETDARGRFVFERIPAGVYSLQVRHQELGRGQVGDVRAGAGFGVTDLRIELSPVFKVRGRIDLSVFGEQKPEWVWMRLEQDGSEPVWSGIDKDDGSFAADGVSPGTWRIVVMHSGTPVQSGELVGAQPVTVVASDVENLTVRLVPAEQSHEQHGGR
ncbi:MAG: carboxypeptidase regulatory-like domain-containing protein [Planctomycetes bacterium]|nr:carboxypeptidase regulatory-like domain-containing protein [Planctomycetota bacterium]